MSPLHFLQTLITGALSAISFLFSPAYIPPAPPLELIPPVILTYDATTTEETTIVETPPVPLFFPEGWHATQASSSTTLSPIVAATSTVATSTPVAISTTTSTTTLTTTTKKKSGSSSNAPLTTRSQEPRYTLAPAGENATLKISSVEDVDPKFVSATIAPLHVYVGETQTLTVKVTSEESIVSVTALTELDHETLSLDLVQTGSDTFSTSWEVYDTHVKTYRTTFIAENASGEENSVTLAWSDPCAGITQGIASSLSSSCTVSDTSGLDGGSLTIPEGTTLTLNSGATWVWNPGTSITVNGSIAVNGTAQIKKGYLFYSGTSNDTANTSTMYYGANSTMTNYVRTGTWFQFSPENAAELLTFYESNTVTITGISNNTSVTLTSDGVFDANDAMSINGGAWVTSGTINPGQTLKVRLKTGVEDLTEYWISASVGGVSSTYTVTTSYSGGGGGCGEVPCR